MKTRIQQLNQTLSWDDLPALAGWALEQGIYIQQIAAPTFDEKKRAEYVAGQFRALGLDAIEVDDVYNVYGVLRGARRDVPGVLLSAHIDTVFPADTDLTTRTEGSLIYGPGLGDNCMGVAGMLAFIEYMRRQNIIPDCDLWFVAPSREEGLGDLGGMKQAFRRVRDLIGMVINIEGLAFGHVYHAGIAVRRLHITASAEGGHSWLHFGRASATHSIVQLGARITELTPSIRPRTTFNIGMLEGGQGINVIATSAGLWLDLRSEESGTLNELEQRVRQEIEWLSSPDLTFRIDVVGDRPAGRIDPEHPLVECAMKALRLLGVSGALEIGSTDGNVPLSAGCPTITIGITRGGNAHRLDEYIETKPIAAGVQQLILIVLASAWYQCQQ